MSERDPRRVLMTGAAGFLGRALISELFDEAERRGESLEVRGLDLVAGEHERPVEWIEASVTDEAALARAFEGVDVVIHSAAMVDWGNNPVQKVREVNVGGTEAVIEACLAAGVGGLIFTSTMDVVMGQGDIRGADESLPYPERPFDNYASSKITAEQLALAADHRAEGGGELRTAVLRPCGVYGERDPYHMSSTFREAEAGKLVMRVGDGDAIFEHVYVGNVAYGHALAAFAMMDDPDKLAGEVYFLTDQPAINFFDFMQPFVEAYGLPFPSKKRSLPTPIAMVVGSLVEIGAKLLRPLVKLDPVLTRSSVHILTTDISFDTDKAERHFGYRPRYGTEEAFERTMAYFREHGPLPR